MERLYSVYILFLSLKFTNSLIEKFNLIEKIIMQNVQLNILKLRAKYFPWLGSWVGVLSWCPEVASSMPGPGTYKGQGSTDKCMSEWGNKSTLLFSLKSIKIKIKRIDCLYYEVSQIFKLFESYIMNGS